jgi:hypothetical protein
VQGAADSSHISNMSADECIVKLPHQQHDQENSSTAANQHILFWKQQHAF